MAAAPDHHEEAEGDAVPDDAAKRINRLGMDDPERSQAIIDRDLSLIHI